MASIKRKIIPLLREAVEAIGNQDYQKGLEFAQQAVDVDPSSEEAIVAKAVCLSRLNQDDLAEEAYRSAIQIAPSNEHAHYNFAIHLLKVNRLTEAYERCQEALAISPHRNENAQLKAKILQQMPEGERKSLEAKKKPIPSAQGELQSDGTEPEHTIKWVKDAEPWWTYFGWAIAVVSAVGFGMLILIHGMQYLSAIASSTQKPKQLPTSSYDGLLRVFGYTAFIGGDAFMILDVIDRRKSPLWLVPGVILNCLGLGWVVLPFYLLIGRKINIIE